MSTASPNTTAPLGTPSPLVLLSVEQGWGAELAPLLAANPLHLPDSGVLEYARRWATRSDVTLSLHGRHSGTLSNVVLALARATQEPWAMAPEEREAWVHIRTAYTRHAGALTRVRGAARAFVAKLARHGHAALLSDLEAEFTCVRVLARAGPVVLATAAALAAAVSAGVRYCPAAVAAQCHLTKSPPTHTHAYTHAHTAP